MTTQPKTLTLKVNDDTQISFGDETYRGGEVFEADFDNAQKFLTAGWATKTTKKAKPKPEAKAEAEPNLGEELRQMNAEQCFP